MITALLVPADVLARVVSHLERETNGRAECKGHVFSEQPRRILDDLQAPALPGSPFAVTMDATIDAVIRAVATVHDGSELWYRLRQDPDSFRDAVRRVLQGHA